MYIMSKKCIERILRDENEAQYKVKDAILATLNLIFGMRMRDANL